MTDRLRLSERESQVLRRALVVYASYCHRRANQIAQDKSGRTKAEWVEQALDEARCAERVLASITHETPPWIGDEIRAV